MLDAVARGELDATAVMVAYLAGVLDALEADL